MEFYKPVNYLVLVNKKHKIEDDYIKSIEFVDVEGVNGEKLQLERQTYDAYLQLEKALAEKNIIIGIDSAYRSVDHQHKLWNEFEEKYGLEYTKNTVAVPGTSEHHTGLAIDIVPKINGKWVIENDDMIKQTDVFKVIHEMLFDYGFILRYPQNKEEITGYSYEPWHIRYVGKKEAKEIYERKLTLEEYIEK